MADVEVICENMYHRRAEVGGEEIAFEPDAETRTSRARASKAQADALARREGYRAPALETQNGAEVKASGEDASQEDASQEDTGEAAGVGVAKIEGIGDTRAGALRAAGVETIGALRAAVPAELAERAGLGEGNIIDWQEQARALVEGEGPEDEA
jgi:hypothetical protein